MEDKTAAFRSLKASGRFPVWAMLALAFTMFTMSSPVLAFSLFGWGGESKAHVRQGVEEGGQPRTVDSGRELATSPKPAAPSAKSANGAAPGGSKAVGKNGGGRGGASGPGAVLDYRWTPGNLTSHWHKHGSEFPELHSEEEYGRFAVNFFRNPPPKVLRKFRGEGDRLQYDEASNVFAVSTKDGVIKTMFRPDRGIRYWNRQ